MGAWGQIRLFLLSCLLVQAGGFEELLDEKRSPFQDVATSHTRLSHSPDKADIAASSDDEIKKQAHLRAHATLPSHTWPSDPLTFQIVREETQFWLAKSHSLTQLRPRSPPALPA